MNGKGDKRRPAQVPERELEERWEQTFRTSDHAKRCYGKGCMCEQKP